LTIAVIVNDALRNSRFATEMIDFRQARIPALRCRYRAEVTVQAGLAVFAA